MKPLIINFDDLFNQKPTKKTEQKKLSPPDLLKIQEIRTSRKKHKPIIVDPEIQITTIPECSFTPKINDRSKELWETMERGGRYFYKEQGLRPPCVESWRRMEVATMASSLSPLKRNTLCDRFSMKQSKPFLARQE